MDPLTREVAYVDKKGVVHVEHVFAWHRFCQFHIDYLQGFARTKEEWLEHALKTDAPENLYSWIEGVLAYLRDECEEYVDPFLQSGTSRFTRPKFEAAPELLQKATRHFTGDASIRTWFDCARALKRTLHRMFRVNFTWVRCRHQGWLEYAPFLFSIDDITKRNYAAFVDRHGECV